MANSKCLFCSHLLQNELEGYCPYWLASFASARIGLPHLRPQKWDVLEFFCGQGNLYRACLAAGLDAIGFDHIHGPSENLHSLAGLTKAVDLILEMRPHGLVWFAPPCSWWTFFNSPNHKRTRENGFIGDEGSIDVRQANSLAHVVAALVRLCSSRGLAVVLEQPADSCFFSFGCIAKSLNMAGASTVTTFLSAFSEEMPIPKKLILKGTCRWLGSLFRNKPSRVFDTSSAYLISRGGGVSGGDGLQATQVYPRAFGEAAPLLAK